MHKALFAFLCFLSTATSYAETLTNQSPQQLVSAALTQTTKSIRYDGSYFKIPYPNGDVPAHLGVCTDVIIRAYRSLNIDLQQLIHEDMRNHFSLYPAKRNWGQTKTDTNIDHRRVPNLQTFFARHGKSLRVSTQGENYQAGDLVTWMLPGNLPHIGIITDKKSVDGLRPLVVHNIGAGPQHEDMLFEYPITGHYRYGWE